MGTPQIWNLRVAQKNHQDVDEYLTKIAEKNKQSMSSLLAAHRLPASDLKKAPTP